MLEPSFTEVVNMSLELITSSLGLITGVGSLLYVIYIAGWKLGRIELQVDTIWEFLMRRAISEAMQKELIVSNSPVIPTVIAIEVFSVIVPKLKKFYKTKGKGLSNKELFRATEVEFGDVFVNDICPKLKITAGACVATAMVLMKEE
jgi:hypothetical protein